MVLEKYEYQISRNYFDFIFGNIELIHQNNVIRVWQAEYSSEPAHFASRIPHPGFAVKTEVAKAVGEFHLRYKIASDYDFILRLLKITQNFAHIDETIIKMSMGGESTKGLENTIRQNLELCRSLNKNGYSLIKILRFIHDRVIFKLGQKVQF